MILKKNNFFWKNPKILVYIVPVYNVAEYLPCCIDSILIQTFTDFELLLIDDAARDGVRDFGRQEGANQVQRARRNDRGLGLQGPRGDRRGHGVGRVMEAVREVERQRRDDDEANDDKREDVHAVLDSSFSMQTRDSAHEPLPRAGLG